MDLVQFMVSTMVIFLEERKVDCEEFKKLNVHCDGVFRKGKSSNSFIGRIALAIPVYELAMSVCLSVRPSVRPSVCQHFG